MQVPFHDLDPMQIVWHGNYLKYFENARQALFDEVGLDMYRFHEEDGVLFPIVRSSVKHVHPLRFRDRFECRARVLDARAKIVLGFEIRLLPDGPICARGQSEQVAVQMPDYALQMRIPTDVRVALGWT